MAGVVVIHGPVALHELFAESRLHDERVSVWRWTTLADGGELGEKIVSDAFPTTELAAMVCLRAGWTPPARILLRLHSLDGSAREVRFDPCASRPPLHPPPSPDPQAMQVAQAHEAVSQLAAFFITEGIGRLLGWRR